MKFPRPFTLRGKTILLVGLCLLISHILSLVVFIIFSASTVTVERDEQIADRIVASARLIGHARASDRPGLAGELSGEAFHVSVDRKPLTDITDDSAAGLEHLVSAALAPLTHDAPADYGAPGDTQTREIASQRTFGLFRIRETLIVSVDLPDGSWLNFRASGSVWDHIVSLDAIPSLAMMALGAILFTAWAVNKPLGSLSRFAKASTDTGINIQAAAPVSEDGPVEIRNAAMAFNQMQSRIRRLLEARNEMLGALSHDFRTPLTRLRLRVESITDDEQRNKAIHDLDEMESMIKFTLAFARNESAGEEREETDLEAMIREIVDSANIPANRASVNAGETVRVVCQPIGIRRALTNIVENAAFHGKEIRITLDGDNDTVVIDIDDDGPGIAPDQRERVFMPFYRLEPSHHREIGGAGLGVSIAQTAVHAHGGTIELLDSPLGGLRVHITLPAARPR